MALEMGLEEMVNYTSPAEEKARRSMKLRTRLQAEIQLAVWEHFAEMALNQERVLTYHILNFLFHSNLEVLSEMTVSDETIRAVLEQAKRTIIACYGKNEFEKVSKILYECFGVDHTNTTQT